MPRDHAAQLCPHDASRRMDAQSFPPLKLSDMRSGLSTASEPPSKYGE